mmetsp:Transcript_21598/g.42418  ORF Transcript_21598/g.42418 Transcript_21598/m.42418 type:complete len:425 (+) Transcript_21598:283-1557(+)
MGACLAKDKTSTRRSEGKSPGGSPMSLEQAQGITNDAIKNKPQPSSTPSPSSLPAPAAATTAAARNTGDLNAAKQADLAGPQAGAETSHAKVESTSKSERNEAPNGAVGAQDLKPKDSANQIHEDSQSETTTREEHREDPEVSLEPRRPLDLVLSARMTTVREMIRVELVGDGRIAVATILGGDAAETFAWGTRVCEHRVNPFLVEAINAALDAALREQDVRGVVVTAEGKFFSNGMDLKWIDANPSEADELQKNTEKLLARILTFPLPTIAAINGHFCAAGAMLGLAFDYRIMNAEKGLFFVPGIDLGLVYSPGMTEIMKAKMPVHMHNEMIVYAKRYSAKDLVQERIVAQAVEPAKILNSAVEFAQNLVGKERFLGNRYRDAMMKIKQRTYLTAYKALTDEDSFEALGFDEGAWDEHGKAKL